MAELQPAQALVSADPEKAVAALGTAGGFTALLSAAACCVLPLALALMGLGSGGLAVLVPFHWPLTIGAGLAVATGWALHTRKRRECSRSDRCAAAPVGNATFAMLCLATALVILSALWPSYIEAPLMRLLSSA